MIYPIVCWLDIGKPACMETLASTRGSPAQPTGTYRQGRVIKKPDVHGEIINQQLVVAQQRTWAALGLKKCFIKYYSTKLALLHLIKSVIPLEIGLP